MPKRQGGRKMNWLEQFKLNYEGQSEEAKSLENLLKKTYKGDAYVPWAVIERLMYMQDPQAELEAVRNEDGGLVHTDSDRNYILNKKVSKSAEKEIFEESEIETRMFSHFVIVKGKFLGVERIETYPIQDSAYQPLKVYDQNAVNKSIQRAKAKLASRLTGIGYKLYEGSDLQFEDTPATTESTPVTEQGGKGKGVKVVQATPKAEVKAEPVASVPTKVETTSTQATPIKESPSMVYAQEILDNEAFEKGLAKVNINLQKTQGFTIARTESAEDIASKLSQIKTLDIFMNALRRQSGIEVK